MNNIDSRLSSLIWWNEGRQVHSCTRGPDMRHQRSHLVSIPLLQFQHHKSVEEHIKSHYCWKTRRGLLQKNNTLSLWRINIQFDHESSFGTERKFSDEVPEYTVIYSISSVQAFQLVSHILKLWNVLKDQYDMSRASICNFFLQLPKCSDFR